MPPLERGSRTTCGLDLSAARLGASFPSAALVLWNIGVGAQSTLGRGKIIQKIIARKIIKIP